MTFGHKLGLTIMSVAGAAAGGAASYGLARSFADDTYRGSTGAELQSWHTIDGTVTTDGHNQSISNVSGRHAGVWGVATSLASIGATTLISAALASRFNAQARHALVAGAALGGLVGGFGGAAQSINTTLGRHEVPRP